MKEWEIASIWNTWKNTFLKNRYVERQYAILQVKENDEIAQVVPYGSTVSSENSYPILAPSNGEFFIQGYLTDNKNGVPEIIITIENSSNNSPSPSSTSSKNTIVLLRR